MGSATATLPDMGSRKEPKKQGRPPGRKLTAPLYARADPALVHAFNEYVEKLRPKTSASAVIEMLVEQLLEKEGLWPPPPAKE